jgi:predicted secreted protein
VTPVRVKSRIFAIGLLLSVLSVVIERDGVPELVLLESVARDRVTADGVAYEAAFVPLTVKVYVAAGEVLVVAEVVEKTKEAFGEVVLSVIEAGVKVKLGFADDATGVMMILLYGGIFVASKVSGTKLLMVVLA